jgi:hypothetical protein
MINQVKGRGIRYLSHAHLPPDQRHVHTERYETVRRPTSVLERIGLKKPGLSTDQYVRAMANRKGHVNQQMHDLMRQVSQGPAGKTAGDGLSPTGRVRSFRLGGGKTVLMHARGAGATQRVSDELIPRVPEQGPVRGILRTSRRIFGDEVANAAEKGLKQNLSKMTIGGTIAGGKSYINMPFTRDQPQSLRNIIHHEGFHRDHPLGHSEILAHAYGGLHQDKGKLNFSRAAKDVGHAFVTRPGRALGEVALATGAAYGAYRAGKYIKSKLSRDPDKKDSREAY